MDSQILLNRRSLAKTPAGMKSKIQNVAIVGAGPAACTLAILLARAGRSVTMFFQPKRAPIIVGESLVPAIIPILRLLGVEDEVRSFSMFKPGATVNISETVNFSFPFDQLRGSLPRYSYNVPRDRFDDTLLEAARRAGAKVIEATARVERVGETDRVKLSQATLDATGGALTGQPDLIVDATGRLRMIPQLLGIPSERGQREDTALFAHVDCTKLDHEGHIHATRLDYGWSWRIPLPGRMSVGIVIGTEFLPKFGTTKEERFDNLLRQDSVLRKVAGDAKRLTPVMEYKNYQLVSTRIIGDGWALVGDTAGFIDPIFSSGLLIAMEGAVALAAAIRKGTPQAFKRYEEEVIHHLQCWHEIVEYFYDGRLFTSFLVGQKMQKNPLVRLISQHLNKHFGGIFTGAASSSRYSVGLLRFVVKYGLKDEDPREMMIR